MLLSWKAEKLGLKKLFTGVTGKTTNIFDIPEGREEIAFTVTEGDIYLAYKNVLTDGLEPTEAVAVRKGLFVHEMLHQIFTDFKGIASMCSLFKSNGEKRIYKLIDNVLEDPAIEYWAPTVIGGSALSSLKYTIARTYKLSPQINTCTSPFSQFTNALIQFGDMGLIKGHFTSPEALKCFKEVSPIFARGIVEPSGSKRHSISMEIFKLCKELWEEEVSKSDEFDKMMDELEDMLKKLGKSSMAGSGKGMPGDENALSGDDEKTARRKITIKEVSKEEYEKLLENASASDACGDSDDSFKHHINCDKASATTANYDADTAESNAESVEEEYNLTDEDIASIKEECKLLEEECEASEIKDSINEDALDDFAIDSPVINGKNCLNYRITYDEHLATTLQEQYNFIITKNSSNIKNLTVRLKRIFENDYDERVFGSSGRINLKRVNSGKVTPRIFDKVKGSKGKDDLAVMILVDESGSMCCNKKYIAAKEACIMLAEVFNNLNIPIYIMGFTGDTRGYDVVHNHYITWKNNSHERLKLLNIAARADNVDGYSIRYASKVLAKRKAKHKLMIVLSDGQPAASGYYGPQAVSDTKLAIREGKKQFSVFGVAIGNDQTNILYSMYGKDFLHINNVKDLNNGLAKKIKDLIKKWD